MELNLMRLITEKHEDNQDMALITVISSGQGSGSMMAVGKDGEILWGSVGSKAIDYQAAEEAKIALKRGLCRNVQIAAESGRMEIFINALCSQDTLLIAGAGNVARHVYRYACILGYKVCIFDNRAEMLTWEKFPEARELMLGDIAEKIASYNITADTSIVIASHNHEFDQDILRAVITSPARYIGMLGNKRRLAAMFEHMRNVGISEEQIANVRAPIGLDLGGRKTAEIALAIIAEIQAVKYGRKVGLVS